MTHDDSTFVNVIDWAVGDPPLQQQRLCAAIGNFDGVHRGHQKVIQAACSHAVTHNLTPAVITFDPHPREFFRQDDVPFHLADRHEKDRLLGQLDVEHIIHVTFDDVLRRTDAKAFVTDILPALGVTQLFAGSDFALGRGRGGDMDTINEIGGSVHITATTVPLLIDDNSVVISSSRIRAALQAGAPEQATTMLGHDWAISGIVQTGDKRGRTIGFPTANIPLGTLLNPAFGVYAVQVFDDDGSSNGQFIANGVANIGIRPTFETRDVLCETHLFDFDGNLYGRRLSVRLKSFLRAERKFSGLEELKEQIAKDASDARHILPATQKIA
ncbi:riboflavin biosynthesis protein RibF [Candidatus Puniceispirillum sp.]|uniref:riboflavin biosynthesis protein RibF n=1 Tax=Candidatus Puniceispirillum sp. TaxID=2026719 RepID=UPI001EBD724B|nr:riboflavin biosynthesis protein RibF [Candidatus Puniceispirillum sp.]